MNIDREDCLSTAKELIGFLEKKPPPASTRYSPLRTVLRRRASHSFMKEKSGSSQRADPTM